MLVIQQSYESSLRQKAFLDIGSSAVLFLDSSSNIWWLKIDFFFEIGKEAKNNWRDLSWRSFFNNFYFVFTFSDYSPPTIFSISCVKKIAREALAPVFRKNKKKFLRESSFFFILKFLLSCRQKPTKSDIKKMNRTRLVPQEKGKKDYYISYCRRFKLYLSSSRRASVRPAAARWEKRAQSHNSQKRQNAFRVEVPEQPPKSYTSAFCQVHR